MNLQDFIADLISSTIKEALQSNSEKPKRKKFSNYTRKKVLKRQGYRCRRCSRILDEADFHHIDGNRHNNHISNCEALCPNCHAKMTRNRLV